METCACRHGLCSGSKWHVKATGSGTAWPVLATLPQHAKFKISVRLIRCKAESTDLQAFLILEAAAHCRTPGETIAAGSQEEVDLDRIQKPETCPWVEGRRIAQGWGSGSDGGTDFCTSTRHQERLFHADATTTRPGQGLPLPGLPTGSWRENAEAPGVTDHWRLPDAVERANRLMACKALAKSLPTAVAAGVTTSAARPHRHDHRWPGQEFSVYQSLSKLINAHRPNTRSCSWFCIVHR